MIQLNILTIIALMILIFLSAMFSGLGLGLMSLDVNSLKRKAKLGNKYAQKIYPLRKDGNLLLTTLLLGNVGVNSAIAIILNSITVGVIAGLISTCLIVIFGEIIPQAAFSRYALKLGGKTYWLIYPFLIVLYPITKPISIILNKVLGKSITKAYSKKEFIMIIKEQKNMQKSDVDKDEYEFLEKSLSYSEKTVENAMTPKSKVFMIDPEQVLDAKMIETIKQRGHSRIPVYENETQKITGILFAKDLLAIDPEKKRRVKTIMRTNRSYVKENTKLDDVLKKFKKEKLHIFIVKNSNKQFVGIITLEDVLEQIMGNILDEHDTLEDKKPVLD